MMKKSDFQQKISEYIGNIKVSLFEPMEKHTSFRIGGPAEVMAFPKDREELASLLILSKVLDCKIAILGAGTNVLAPDKGVDGLVICLKDCLDGMRLLDNDRIYVAGGVTLSRTAVFAAGHGLSGMEFAHGIPGTVGGGVFMNAGAYGGEIAQICESVEVMSLDGVLTLYQGSEMDFSYRHSRLENEPGIVVGATFKLEKSNEEQVRAGMQDLMKRRKASQPLDMPSAGSAFKRPATGYAAALIDEAGLKGYAVGGAAVSEKHAGFVVNLGGATAADVKKLLDDVSDRVFERTGIRLEPEVRIW